MTQRIKPKLKPGAIPSVFENPINILDISLNQVSCSFAQNECFGTIFFEVID